MLIDTHTHLYSEAFAEDRTAMIERALNAGVHQFLLPNIDVDSIPGMYALEQQFPSVCFPMMGLHPTSVKEDWEAQLAFMQQELNKRKFIAIGEIGMDLYWDKSFQAEQTEAFKIQIEWAKKLQIPIVIHAREAFQEIYEVLDEVNDDRLKGVFHCFTGTLEDVKKIRSYKGFIFGIGGVVTFKKSGLDTVVEQLLPHEILLETDSPYLAPMPYRGKRNESAYLPHIATKIAEVLQISVEQVAELTTKNAKKLFSL